MSHELVYTSAPRGLKPGSGGFCIVAASPNMPKQAVTKLELLSGYEFPFGLSDPNADLNPANFAHTRIELGGETRSVLSRIAFSGADYSGRANRIAHHFLLSREEQLATGPAWMLQQMLKSGYFRPDWHEAPGEIPGHYLAEFSKQATASGLLARRWKELAGDAGWAGVLAKAFADNKNVPAFVVFKPGQEILPLFVESMAVLPVADRWQVAFASYFTSLPAGCQYHWRGVLADSPAARDMKRFPNALVIDLTKPPSEAPDNEYTEAARMGRVFGKAPEVVDVSLDIGAQEAEAPAAAPAVIMSGAGKGPDRGTGEPIAAKRQVVSANATPRVEVMPPAGQSTKRRRRLLVALAVAAAIVLLFGVILYLWYEIHGLKGEIAKSGVAAPLGENKGSGTEAAPPTRVDNDAVVPPVQERNPTLVTPVPVPNPAPPQPEPVPKQPPLEVPPKPVQVVFQGIIGRDAVRAADGTTKPVERWLVDAWRKPFSVETSNAFLDLPESIARAGLTIREKGGTGKKDTVVIECKSRGGFGQQALVTCKLTAVPGNVELGILEDDGLKKKENGEYRQMVQFLVVEVQDDKTGKVQQCAFRSQPKVAQCHLGYGEDGVMKSSDSIEFKYPWPDTLSFDVSHHKPGWKGLGNNLWTWEGIKFPGLDATETLKLRLTSRSGTVTVECPLLAKITEYGDRVAVEDRLLKKLHQELDKVNADITKLKAERDKGFAKVAANEKISDAERNFEMQQIKDLYDKLAFEPLKRSGDLSVHEIPDHEATRNKWAEKVGKIRSAAREFLDGAEVVIADAWGLTLQRTAIVVNMDAGKQGAEK